MLTKGIVHNNSANTFPFSQICKWTEIYQCNLLLFLWCGGPVHAKAS